jgi:hypothetical protein
LALTILGALLLACGVIAVAASGLGLYALNHKGLYTCTAEPPPVGALPFEGVYAGDRVVAFPAAGVECSWNATDGGVFSTLIPDPVVTGIVWAAILLPLAGIALLVAARARGRRLG